jgi:hypothetical protein
MARTNSQRAKSDRISTGPNLKNNFVLGLTHHKCLRPLWPTDSNSQQNHSISPALPKPFSTALSPGKNAVMAEGEGAPVAETAGATEVTAVVDVEIR